MPAEEGRESLRLRARPSAMARGVVYERGPNRPAPAAMDVCLVDGDGALRATPKPSAAPPLRRRVDALVREAEGRHVAHDAEALDERDGRRGHLLLDGEARPVVDACRDYAISGHEL